MTCYVTTWTIDLVPAARSWLHTLAWKHPMWQGTLDEPTGQRSATLVWRCTHRHKTEAAAVQCARRELRARAAETERARAAAEATATVTVNAAALTRILTEAAAWQATRTILADREEQGERVDADDWHASDDHAASIVTDLTTAFPGIL